MIIDFPLAERDCYACFDMARAGPHTCPACGRPHGERLPEADRPPMPVKYWLDLKLDPRPAAPEVEAEAGSSGRDGERSDPTARRWVSVARKDADHRPFTQEPEIKPAFGPPKAEGE